MQKKSPEPKQIYFKNNLNNSTFFTKYNLLTISRS